MVPFAKDLSWSLYFSFTLCIFLCILQTQTSRWKLFNQLQVLEGIRFVLMNQEKAHLVPKNFLSVSYQRFRGPIPLWREIAIVSPTWSAIRRNLLKLQNIQTNYFFYDNASSIICFYVYMSMALAFL